jgi:hypothetical protein
MTQRTGIALRRPGRGKTDPRVIMIEIFSHYHYQEGVNFLLRKLLIPQRAIPPP